MQDIKIYAADKAYDDTRIHSAWMRAVSTKKIKASMLDMANANQPGKKEWFVIETKPNREKTVEKFLSDAGVHVYLPLEATGKSVQRGKVIPSYDRPMFPGYLLANLVHSPAAICGLCRVDGIAGMVGGMITPHRVSNKEMTRFKVFAGEYDSTKAHAGTFSRGDWVRFEEGPFVGIKGRIVKLRKVTLIDGMEKVALTGMVVIDVNGLSHTINTPLAFLEKL